MVYNRFNMKEKNKRASVVAADMGYGHQRAVYPLKDIAEDHLELQTSPPLLEPSRREVRERLQNDLVLYVQERQRSMQT